MADKKCKDVIDAEWAGRRKDLEAMLASYPEAAGDEPGKLSEYFLNVTLFDAEESDEEDARAFVQCMMSWGGPSDEIRIYADGGVAYVYKDWYDVASIDVTCDEVAADFVNWVRGTGQLAGLAGK